MKQRHLVALLVSFLFSIVSAPLFAHHGNAAYDYEKTVTVKGTVTDWVWANPHSWLKIDVADDKGNVQHWILEGGNTTAGRDTGTPWGKTSLKPGDAVTVNVMPAKNGTTVGRIRRVFTPDGKVLMGGGGTTTLNDVPTPKKPAKPADPSSN